MMRFRDLLFRDSTDASSSVSPSVAYITDWFRLDGAPVPYRRLTDSPEVHMAVNAYAQTVASMSMQLLENSELGDKRIRNGLSRLVDISPHPYLNRRAFYELIVRTLLLHGDGNQVTVPVLENGYIKELIPLAPEKVMIGYDKYEIIYDGRKKYKPNEVLHFSMRNDPSMPWRGCGFSVLLRDVLASMKQSEMTRTEIQKHPLPSLIVKVDASAGAFKGQEAREKLASEYISEREAGRPWFIPSGLLDVQPINPLSINDMAIKDGLELDKKAIASLLGVPAFMLGVGEFNAEAYNNFIQSRVLPIAQIIEQELTRKLVERPDWYFRFNYRSLYSYSLSDKVNAGATMTSALAMSRNEWRDWLGLPPREDMEELIVLENYIPADKIGDQKKLN